MKTKTVWQQQSLDQKEQLKKNIHNHTHTLHAAQYVGKSGFHHIQYSPKVA